MIPRGYDPERDIVFCEDCGSELDVDTVEVRSLGEVQPISVIVSSIACSRSPSHDVNGAYHALRQVRIAHLEEDKRRTCSAVSLPFWRERGWFAVDAHEQTPDEAVHAEVRRLGGGSQ